MTPKIPIYLDSHATTPCDPRVVEAMLPCFSEKFGNPASKNHAFGWEAEALVENAREQVAQLIGCNPKEIIFTSGATESDNLAIKGAAHAYREKGRHIITDAIEHRAVLDTCARLEAEGFRVTTLPVPADGRIPVEVIQNAITPETTLISVMFANNEIGTINPVREIGELCKQCGILFHCDAVQALAYLPCNVGEMGVDLLSISAHKMYGPKGIGALYVRRRNPRVTLEPLIDGGGHERGLRSGTLNVPGVVGFGKACEIAGAEGRQDSVRIAKLRDRLLAQILKALPDTVINGSMDHRLPNNLNVSFPYIESDALLMAMPSIAASSGSACTSANLEPSHVLRAIGVREDTPQASIRFGLHRFTTDEEIDYAAGQVIAAVNRLRSISPLLSAPDAALPR